MKKFRINIVCVLSVICISFKGYSNPIIYINQVGFDVKGAKIVVIGVDKPLSEKTIFNLVNTVTGKTEFTATLGKPQRINEWVPGKIFYQADFSSFKKQGTYQL